MNDEEALEAVREALIWTKAEVFTLVPSQINPTTVLAEPPIHLDSLEFVAMVTRLEEALGLIADDDHFSPQTMRTVRDVVAGVMLWVSNADTDMTWS